MRHNKLIVALGLAFLIVCLPTLSMAAQWKRQAENLFYNDKYEECIELIKGNNGLKNNSHATMFLAFSNLQLFQFTKAKHFKKRYNALFEISEARTKVEDLRQILFFVNLVDKPDVVKSGRKLFNKITKNLYKVEDVIKLVEFANSSDETVRRMSCSAIARILKPKRAIVKKGGTLREKDIAIFAHKGLIKALAKHSDESKAVSALVLIEEPSLPYLSDTDNEGALKARLKIESAIEKRKKKFPSSNWYSATGRKRI